METYFGLLREGLAVAGHDVKLLTSTAGDAAQGSADYRAYGTDLPAAQAFLQVVNPFALAGVRSAVREFRPDVAYVGMFEQHLSPVIFAALRTVPTALSVGDYKPICPIHSKLLPDSSLCRVPAGTVCWRGGCVSFPHWLRDQPRYALIRAAFSRVDRILACSEWLRDELLGAGIPAEALHLAASPPSSGFRRVPARDPVFVFVGRLSREKGVESLLRAFARTQTVAPSARLRLVGDGPERPRLERLAARLGLSAETSFAGWLQPAEVERELSCAWAMVAPSLWAEPFGIVAIEAITRGVPVIASTTGGLAETVQEGIEGLLFPNGDETALASCLEEVACARAFPSHTLSDEIVQRALNRHNPKGHVARVEQICREIAGSAKQH